MILLSWLIALLVNLPFVAGLDQSFGRASGVRGDCMVRPAGDGQSFQAILTLDSHVPVTLTALVYIAIVIQNNVQWRRIAAHSADRRVPSIGPATRRRMMVTRMLCVYSLWFTLCFIPITITSTLLPMLSPRGRMSIRLWSKTLTVCGYAFSPVC